MNVDNFLCRPCTTRLDLVCPVRPSLQPETMQDADGWENLADGPIQVIGDGEIDNVGTDDEVDLDSGQCARRPKGIPEPYAPSAAERALHNLTHWPYRSWCEHCLRSRRPNASHTFSPSSSDRSVPVLVADYCYLRDSRDEDLAEVFVGRLYPSRMTIAMVVREKGANDEDAVETMSKFLIECGVTKMVYKSDQESALKNFVKASVRRAGATIEESSGDDEVFTAIPEYSAVGESASNGKAERAIQQVEDLTRTLKSALEARIGARIGSTHPMFAWMVRHAAMILSRFNVNADGRTPYQTLHGKRATDKLIELGEVVYFYVPKKLRHKMDQRWRLGVYLGPVSDSNEIYCGVGNGNVLKSRSVARVVADRRWSRVEIEKISGTPLKPTVTNDGSDWTQLEQLADPHANKDADLVPEEELQGEARDVDHETAQREMRITDEILKKYGHTENCPRCTDILRGKTKRTRHHNRQCRARIYLRMLEANDLRFARGQPPRDEPQVEGGEDLPPPAESDAQPRSSQSTAHSDEIPQVEPNQHEPEDFDWMEHLGDSSKLDIDVDEEPDTDEEIMRHMSDDEPEDADMDKHDDLMVDALMLAGVTTKTAKAVSKSLIGDLNNPANAITTSSKHENNKAADATFIEVFGRGEICKEANSRRRNLNIEGLDAFDLRTCKSDGTPWNFNRSKDRLEARQIIKTTKPTWIIGSPPCTPFCIWNVAMNYPKSKDPDAVRRAIREGRRHLNFMISLYQMQVDNGRHFLHEHPASAVSWKEPQMAALARRCGVHAVVADQCMYGLVTKGPNGDMLPAMKPTRFLTSSPQMAARLSKRCKKEHVHQHLVGGRCFNASFYPLGLIRAILLGIRDTADAAKWMRHRRSESEEIIYAVQEATSVIPGIKGATTQCLGKSTVLGTDGTTHEILFKEENFKDKYVDEYTGEVLRPELIRAAMMAGSGNLRELLTCTRRRSTSV